MEINLYIEEKAYSFKFDAKLRDVLRRVLEDNPGLGDLRHLDEYRLVSDSGEDLDPNMMICETDLEDSSRLCVRDDNLSVEQRLSEERWLEKVSRNGKLLSCVKCKTEKLCLAAVKDNPLALQYLENPSMVVVHEAFTKDPQILKFLDTVTEKRYIDYVSQDQEMFKTFIENISGWSVFPFLKNKTRNIFREIANVNPHMMKYFLDEKEALKILINTKCSGHCYCFEDIECVEEQDCLTAISNGHSINRMKCRSKTIYIAALKNSADEFRYIPDKDKTEDICRIAIDIDKKFFSIVPIQPEDISLKLIREDVRYFKQVKDKTKPIMKVFIQKSIWIPGMTREFIERFISEFIEYYNQPSCGNRDITSMAEFITAIRAFKIQDALKIREILLELYDEETQ